MTESMKVFVLMTLSIGSQGEVVRKNVGVTFCLHEAEDHQNKDISNEFETFQIDANWQEDAATTNLVTAMREFTGMVREMQEEALR
jgi:hypothetical protein